MTDTRDVHKRAAAELDKLARGETHRPGVLHEDTQRCADFETLASDLREAGKRCVPESTHSISFQVGVHGVTVGKKPDSETWRWTVWCLDGPGILRHGTRRGMQAAIAEAIAAAEAETQPRGGDTDAGPTD